MFGGVPAPRPAAEGPAESAEPAEPGETRVAASAARPPEPPRIAVRPDEPGEPPDGVLRLYGIIYDMKTLKPILNAVVTLTGPPSGSAATTDQDGHYQLDFALPGVGADANDPQVIVGVSAPGYREGQIEDPDPPYLLWPLKKRLGYMAELTPADMAAVTLRHRPSDTIIPLDLVLVPKDASPSK